MSLRVRCLSSSAMLVLWAGFSVSAVSAQTPASVAPSPRVNSTVPAGPDKAKPYKGGLEEVVVTARRRSERLQKVPVSVTALSSRDIKAQAIETLTDIQRQTPSLTISTNVSDPSSATISIRGQVQNDVIPSVEPSVGIYVDDVYYGQTIGTTLAHAFDLSGIEVLKGPQGTLYGFNTTGGAIKIDTSLPTDGYHASLQVGLGDYNRHNGAVMANFPLVPGVLDLRVVGQYDSHSGYGVNTVTNTGLENEDSGSFRGALKFTPTPDLTVIWRGEYSKSGENGGVYKPLYISPNSAAALDAALEKDGFAALAGGLPAAYLLGEKLYDQQVGGDLFTVAYNTPTSNNALIFGSSLNVAYDFDGLTLKSITAYRQTQVNDQLDLDGSSFGFLETAQQDGQKQVTQEFQVLGDGLDSKLKYQAGVFYLYRTALYTSNSNDLLGLAALGAVQNPAYATSTYDKSTPSVYGQAEYAITPRINLTAGLRYTEESDTLGNSSYNGGTSLTGKATCNVPPQYNVNGSCHVTESNSDRNLSYTFGIDYTPVNDVFLYAKTSRGFKSGGINLRVSAAPASLTTFLPETVEDYEGGVKSTLLNNHLRLNAAVYHSNYSNYQASVIESDNGALYTVVQNARSAEINGVELEGTAVPIDNLSFHATAAWTDPHYDNFYVNNGVETVNEEFRNFLQTPRWTASLTGSYAIPTAYGLGRISIDYSYRGDADLEPSDTPGVAGPGTPGTPTSLRIQRDFSLVNAEAQFHVDAYNVDILIYGKNILNRHYLEGELGVVSAGLGTAVGIPGAPSTFGIDLTKNF